MKTIPKTYYTAKQGHLPVFLEEYLEVTEPVMAFDRYMGGIEIEKYLRKVPRQRMGRNRYNPVNILKTVVFGFMEKGYISLR